jgi:hypothetical protein
MQDPADSEALVATITAEILRIMELRGCWRGSLGSGIPSRCLIASNSLTFSGGICGSGDRSCDAIITVLQ